MRIRIGSVLLLVLAVPVLASALVHESPVDGSDFLFDLGASPIAVLSVELDLALDVTPSRWDCDGSEVETPLLFTFRIEDDSGALISLLPLELYGPYDEVAVLEPDPVEGWSALSGGTGGLDIGVFYVYEGVEECENIAWGSEEFLAGSVLRIVYEPVVPADRSRWGAVKALYR